MWTTVNNSGQMCACVCFFFFKSEISFACKKKTQTHFYVGDECDSRHCSEFSLLSACPLCEIRPPGRHEYSKSKVFAYLCSDLLNWAFFFICKNGGFYRNLCCRWEDTLSFSLKSNDLGGWVQPKQKEKRLSLPQWHFRSLFHSCCLSSVPGFAHWPAWIYSDHWFTTASLYCIFFFYSCSSCNR